MEIEVNMQALASMPLDEFISFQLAFNTAWPDEKPKVLDYFKQRIAVRSRQDKVKEQRPHGKELS